MRFWGNVIQVIILVAVFILPYWLFDGRLSIGGDDGRLYFIFSDLWIKNLAWFSWFNFSSIGLHNPQQFIIPIVAFFALLNKFLPPLVVSNLAFSLPIALGFIFFQKMIHAMYGADSKSNASNIAAMLGSLFFVCSPIIWTITIAPFLYAVWLLALLPILSFYFFKYLQSGRLLYVLYGSIASIFLSLGFMAVPWLLGAIIPVAASLLICALLFQRSEIVIFLKRAMTFSSVMILMQSFWLLPFVMSLLDKSGSFARSALSSATQDTFSPTVVETMFQNNILYPVLNLFHRSIVFKFSWPIKPAFEHVYDNVLVLNAIYVVIVLLAFLLHRRSAEPIEKKTFFILIVAWIVSLFLFTVNIGPLRDAFLMLGSIPGAGMFRNAFDKFAIGFIFIYATLISFSLRKLLQNPFPSWGKYKAGLIGIFIIVVMINLIPIKTLVNRPLWTTANIYTTINIPAEYSDFIEVIKRHTPATSSILGIPFAFPAYAIIKDASSKNAYVGASPLKILAGNNDFSGFLSFYSDAERERFFHAVLSQDFAEVECFFRDYNIGYILLTKNIPREVFKTYIFAAYPDHEKFNKQMERWLRSNLLGAKVAMSENGAYELYRTSVPISILDSNNLIFRKISPVKYKLSIRGVSERQVLIFKDSFSLGWKLYLDKSTNLTKCQEVATGLPANVKECEPEHHLFDWEDIQYLWRNNLPFIHSPGKTGISNDWVIDKQVIQDVAGGGYFKHPDGTTDVEMTLYFYPQLYFYLGIIISSVALLLLALFAFNQARPVFLKNKSLIIS